MLTLLGWWRLYSRLGGGGGHSLLSLSLLRDRLRMSLLDDVEEVLLGL